MNFEIRASFTNDDADYQCFAGLMNFTSSKGDLTIWLAKVVPCDYFSLSHLWHTMSSSVLVHPFIVLLFVNQQLSIDYVTYLFGEN